MTEKKAKRWAGELLLVWMVLYNWYRFDYYNEKSILGTVLHGCGKLLHIPMKEHTAFTRSCANATMKSPPALSAIRCLYGIWRKIHGSGAGLMR